MSILVGSSPVGLACHIVQLTEALLVQVNLAGSSGSDHFGDLFAEELGLVLEVAPENEQQVMEAYSQAGLTAHPIGRVTSDAQISISVQDSRQISGMGLQGFACQAHVDQLARVCLPGACGSACCSNVCLHSMAELKGCGATEPHG